MAVAQINPMVDAQTPGVVDVTQGDGIIDGCWRGAIRTAGRCMKGRRWLVRRATVCQRVGNGATAVVKTLPPFVGTVQAR